MQHASTDPDFPHASLGCLPTGGLGRPVHLTLGERSYDLVRRVLVMGILNRTPDSFFDAGTTFALDALLRRAQEHVASGADILDVGGVRAGPGPAVGTQQELDRVIPPIAELAKRFDAPISIDTWSAEVAAEAFRAGAVLGNDISGFADPGYLPAAARYGASVVATHIRLAPRVPDPAPGYPAGDVVATVTLRLRELVGRAAQAGIPGTRVILDAGLDLGKTPAQSVELLAATRQLAGIGPALLLSASNKTFLGSLLDLGVQDRRWASLAALTIGVSAGCRVVRVHDVAGAVQACRTLEACLAAV